MTHVKPNKGLKLVFTLLCAFVLCAPVQAAREANTYQEAIEMADEQGVIAYCYGADWNKRSVRMLNSFWKHANTKQAAGNAVMVAVPFYQSSEHPKAGDAAHIKGSMPGPHAGVCPAVLMFDKNGRLYASLIGSDHLGDEAGALGQENIKAKLAALKKQQELMAQAENAQGQEKAKLIQAACELGIAAPPGATEALAAADPDDKTGLVRRHKHNALLFMYEQLETTDGFLAADFEEELSKIKVACLKIINDEALRPIDRQAAYNLYLGCMRRNGQGGAILRNLIKRNEKLEPETWYGQSMPALANLWPKITKARDAESRKAEREARKASAKNKRTKKQQEKKAERSIQIL